MRHHQVGGLVVHLAHQEDHALIQQARVDVVRALAAAGLLDDHGDEAEGLGGVVIAHESSEWFLSKQMGPEPTDSKPHCRRVGQRVFPTVGL